MKLDVVPHRCLDELQTGRDLFVDIRVRDHYLFRDRIAKEPIKARGMVHVFIRDPEISSWCLVTGPPGTDRRSKKHAPMICQIGLLVR